jgi:hypothetical protein
MEDISRYFAGVAWKYLSAVDAEPDRSNQHELGGLVNAGFKVHLGDPGLKTVRFPARFIYLAESEEKNVSIEGQVSWYDARRDNPSRGPEIRLYYVSNSVTDIISEGMFLVIAKTTDGQVLLIFAEPGGSEEQQLRWLFNLQAGGTTSFSGKPLDRSAPRSTWASRWILDELGILAEEPVGDWLEMMLDQFDGRFPATREFSTFAMRHSGAIDPRRDADEALMQLMDTEERLFRILEQHFVEKKLEDGFSDVESFISYSLSIQNRRKSRVGYALENHLEHIFIENSLTYRRGAVTENRAKPDFLFPGDLEYHDDGFPEAGLLMLGAKSTCKDRWRQVLSEARRIPEKHLITLEPAISASQTEEMQANKLQLVVPQGIHETYKPEQQSWLWSLGDFLALVRDKQDHYLKKA